MTISPASLAGAAVLLLGLGLVLIRAGLAAGERRVVRWAADSHEPLWEGDE